MDMNAQYIRGIINRPVTIMSWHGTYLQNASPIARFENKNRLWWEWLIVLPGDNGLYIIKSYRDGNNLQALPDGSCLFASQDENEFEKFNIETDGEHFFFVSPRHEGRVMRANENRDAFLANTCRLGWEAMIVEPVELTKDIPATIVDIQPRY